MDGYLLMISSSPVFIPCVLNPNMGMCLFFFSVMFVSRSISTCTIPSKLMVQVPNGCSSFMTVMCNILIRNLIFHEKLDPRWKFLKSRNRIV